MDSPASTAPQELTTRRMAALRVQLADRDLAGFVVPHADPHQGEWMAERDARLAWLTGFTGSAGMAVVLRERAALFVDGRYTLQAAQQVPADLFEHRHSVREPVADWIGDNLQAGDRLGYDPWLHPTGEAKRLKEAAEKAGAELVALEDNPIDAIWPDQPPPPEGPAVAYPAAFAGESSADKRARIGSSLKEAGADAAVLTATESTAWLLNLRGSDLACVPVALAFSIVRANGAVDLFIDPGKVDDAVRKHLGKGVELHPLDEFGPVLDDLGHAKKTVQIDPQLTPDWVARRVRDAGGKLTESRDPTSLPRSRKNETELSGIRAAHIRDGAALSRFLHWFAKEAPAGGLTEMSAAERLAQFRADGEHYRGPSFDTISGAGANGAIVHYRVTPETDRKIEPDMLYLVDSGGQYLDGTTDVTRTVAVGTPTDEERRRFTQVLKGHIALATVRFPKGTTGAQLDTLARQFLWRDGVDYDHGTGHGVGAYLRVHEGPQGITSRATTVALAPGMVLSNEPGYYKTDAYGIRIENLVIVREAKGIAGAERELLEFETVTLAPIDLALIDESLLTVDERSWLADYHRRVAETLGPLVGEETGAWLSDIAERSAA